MLDAIPGQAATDPLDVMARMWRGAVQMLALQSMELGYTMALEGNQLADIIAFVSSTITKTCARKSCHVAPWLRPETMHLSR